MALTRHRSDSSASDIPVIHHISDGSYGCVGARCHLFTLLCLCAGAHDYFCLGVSLSMEPCDAVVSRTVSVRRTITLLAYNERCGHHFHIIYHNTTSGFEKKLSLTLRLLT